MNTGLPSAGHWWRELIVAVKELSRDMAAPKETNFRALKRLGRHLRQYPRYANRFGYEDSSKEIVVYVDTDHAGCLRTRRSTTRGVLKMGDQCIEGWSHTQKVIALSSGEAEYYGAVKGASAGIGCRSLLEDLGIGVGGMQLRCTPTPALRWVSGAAAG